jgi:hypothetical protein
LKKVREGGLVNPNLLTIIYYINEGESKNIDYGLMHVLKSTFVWV